MYRFILAGLILIGSLFPFSSQAQEDLILPEDREYLHVMEDTIALLSFAIINDSFPEHRFGATHKLIPTLVEALKTPNSFYYPFERAKSMSIQYPADSSFRVFTWQLYVSENEYRYYGAIQMNTPELQLFPLIDRSYEMTGNLEKTTLSPQRWYGSVYYNIYQFDSPQGRKYLLFGYDGFSFFHKRKLIEVLSFEDGKPVFGAPVFQQVSPEEVVAFKYRILLEYGADASISCNYDPILEGIVFDHLIEMGGLHPDQGPTNVPDGSYEGYRLSEQGIWEYVPKYFNQIQEEPPRPMPVFDEKREKQKDLFGRERKN
jgi:hypothetical protein